MRLREAQRRKAERAVCAVLEAHARRNARPRAVDAYEQFNPQLLANVEPLRGYALRAPQTWRCRIKSKSEERRFLDFIRYCFARYPVAAHLERAWIAHDPDTRRGDGARRPDGGQWNGVRPDFRRWYLIAAQGGSLYKQEAQAYLSRQETHCFLTAPDEVTSTDQAFWYAIARAHGAAPGLAVRIAQSRLRGHAITSAFWKDAARFFARNPLPLAEINDLIDYLRAAREEDAEFSLKGRTVTTLKRRMEAWHRALRKQREICGGAWEGSPLPDVTYEVGGERKKGLWHFRQIKTGDALFREGQRMHHCVASYKWRCMNGQVSIWSVTSEYPLGLKHRGVTIELRADSTIVQCRGFANRLPQANERTMVERWAREHGLDWQSS
jgi:hypothetical protein